MSSTAVIILAAGQGTRMKSDLPKVLHAVNGVAMIDQVLAVARGLRPTRTVVVVGHLGERVRDHLALADDLIFVDQTPQLGTGDAVRQCLPALEGFQGTAVVLSGDVPLIQAAELGRLVTTHHERRAVVTLFTAIVDTPGGLGRIVRDDAGRFHRIVEAKDAEPHELAIHEINAGIYCFDADLLRRCLPNVTRDNAQGEFYLPDVVAMAVAERGVVEALPYGEPAEVLGVNSRLDLAHASAHARRLVNEALMAGGVTLVDPATTYIEGGVDVGRDTVLHPGVCLRGATRIGVGCEIGPYSSYVDAVVGDGVRDRGYSHVEGCTIAAAVLIGPYSRLRPGAEIATGAHIGNFVEVKKSRIGAGSKVNHLSYIGDTEMGAGVNVGAGTITCNYDGANKHKTVIGDDVFIGSDTQLVAPVTVGDGALIGAGTTVTQDVPAEALTLTRAPQENRPGAGKKYLDRARQIAAAKKKRAKEK